MRQAIVKSGKVENATLKQLNSYDVATDTSWPLA